MSPRRFCITTNGGTETVIRKAWKGEEIPLLSRIIAVIDAFDAMISDRPYRPALTKEEALEELRKNAGIRFDPRIVKIFFEAIQEESD